MELSGLIHRDVPSIPSVRSRGLGQTICGRDRCSVAVPICSPGAPVSPLAGLVDYSVMAQP